MKLCEPCRWRGWRWGVLGMCVVAALGCGTEHGTIPVSGAVRVNGQAPPGAGKVIFTPVEASAGFTERAGVGQFGTDGQYAAQSFQPDDGLYPGRYLVGVECWETPPNMDGKPVKSYIDQKYTNPEESGLELVVEPGASSVDFDIDIP